MRPVGTSNKAAEIMTIDNILIAEPYDPVILAKYITRIAV